MSKAHLERLAKRENSPLRKEPDQPKSWWFLDHKPLGELVVFPNHRSTEDRPRFDIYASKSRDAIRIEVNTDDLAILLAQCEAKS